MRVKSRRFLFIDILFIFPYFSIKYDILFIRTQELQLLERMNLL